MWKSVVLVLLLQNFCCHGIDILRCCKDHEGVVLTQSLRNNLECRPANERLELKVTSRATNRVTNEIPSNWDFQYSVYPDCPDSHILNIVYHHMNNLTNYYKLHDDGSLKLFLQGEEVLPPSRFCIANNAFVACRLRDQYNRPFQPVRKTFKKCCGENKVTQDFQCANNEKQRWTMEEDLKELLQIKTDYFNMNNIVLETGFPHCPNNDLTLSHARSHMYRPDASVVLDNSHVIATGEFCIERERGNNGDHIAVYTCSKDAHSSQNYTINGSASSSSQKTFRKCCNENYILKNSACVQGDTQWTIEKDLSDLIDNKNDYFNINNIRIISGYPTCRYDWMTYRKTTYMSLRFNYDASITVDNGHDIPADQFCLDRSRIYGKDYMTLITCSDSDPESSGSNSNAVRSNIYAFLIYACLHYFVKLLL